jgi:type II secretory pathway pseudopilin PulG
MNAFVGPEGNRGSALGLTLIALLILSASALALATLQLASRQTTDADAQRARATYVARAAMERATAEFLLPRQDWSTLSAGPLLEDQSFASGTYDVRNLGSTTNSAVFEIVAAWGDRTQRYEIRIHRRTDSGAGSGTTQGASFGPLLDRRLSPDHVSLVGS